MNNKNEIGIRLKNRSTSKPLGLICRWMLKICWSELITRIYIMFIHSPSLDNTCIWNMHGYIYKPFQPNFTSFPLDHGSLPFILCYCVYLKFNVNLSFKCKVNYGFDFTGDDYIGTGNLFNVSILPVDSIQRFTAHSLLCVQYPQIRRNWCEYQNFVW